MTGRQRRGRVEEAIALEDLLYRRRRKPVAKTTAEHGRGTSGRSTIIGNTYDGPEYRAPGTAYNFGPCQTRNHSRSRPDPPPASPLVVGKNNLRTAPISPSQGVGAAPEGLSQVYEALVKKAEEALRWYEVSQRVKRRGAHITRSVAIGFGALAAILPTVVTALPDQLGDCNYPVVRLNAVATALGVVAGTMILLDKLYGYSSSWIRYATAGEVFEVRLEKIG